MHVPPLYTCAYRLLCYAYYIDLDQQEVLFDRDWGRPLVQLEGPSLGGRSEDAFPLLNSPLPN